MRWVALILALAVYLGGFLLDHVEWQEPGFVDSLFFASPFAAVIAAARVWPSWWLIPIVFVFFSFVPIGVDELERELPWYPEGVYGPGYYELSGMDYLTTSFLAILAFPAVVFAGIVVPIARLRARYSTTMDLGDPTSYLTLDEGTPVLTCDGERIGTVTHVLADASTDIFDGLVIDTGDGPRFADAPEVASLHERGVTLTLDAAAVAKLPSPHANPATLETGPDDTVPEHLHDKLKRAWNLISGDY